MVDIKYDAFEKKRQDKIAVVKSERNAIIQYAERKMRITSETSPLKGTAQPEKVMDAADFEEMRMEALKRRQEKELNKIVENTVPMNCNGMLNVNIIEIIFIIKGYNG